MSARVALLGADNEARAQLRAALSEAGAEIVHEGDPRQTDSEALRASGAGTLIVNLDPGLDEAIAHLDALFHDPSLQVVFNESEVTQRLSGWDLARWARHLVAKVLGHGDATPPLPPGAEALPLRDLQPEPMTRAGAAVEDHAAALGSLAEEARLSEQAVPVSHLPNEPVPAKGIGAEPLLEVVAEDADMELTPVALEKPLPETASAQYLDPGEVIEIDDFELVTNEELAGAARRLGPDEPTIVLPRAELTAQLGQAQGRRDEGLLSPRRGNDEPTMELDLGELEAGLESLDLPDLLGVEAGGAENVGLDLSVSSDELGIDGGGEIEGMIEFDEGDVPRLGGAEDEFDLSVDADVAALAAQLDALADNRPAPVAALEELDFGRDETSSLAFDSEPAAPPARPEPPVRPAASASAPSGFGELSLVDVDAGLPARAAAAASKPASFDTSALSLAPLEGEAGPPGADAGTGPGRIQRVVVLGASIGGPDALRSFLAALPAGFPALFLLVQHLEGGFFSRFAQQMQKSCALRVRVAGEDSEPLQMGEVLVLPSDARYAVLRDGSLQRDEYATPPRYKPCIDDALRAAADEFGSDALAVIFSGMAGDAVEGASHLTAMGGEVWGQDPSSCVVSSMIDGARARGLLEVVASPRELAEKLVARVSGA